MWLMLSLVSAFFLGIYDVAKKQAVTGNAVLPVLFFTTFSGAICTLPIIVVSLVSPMMARQGHIFITPQPLSMHLLIMAKSLIVGSSWVLSYFGLKHLPLTIATPLRATAPLFTVLGAVFLFGERPTPVQWSAIILILISYFLYSRSTRKDKNTKASTVWIVFMILAAITGALSGGFDKYLLQTKSLQPLFVLSWFLLYSSITFGVITLIFWFPQRKKSTTFSFRLSIPIVGLLLVFADVAYMNALSNPLAKLALVSAIRRSNVILMEISELRSG